MNSYPQTEQLTPSSHNHKIAEFALYAIVTIILCSMLVLVQYAYTQRNQNIVNNCPAGHLTHDVFNNPIVLGTIDLPKCDVPLNK